MFMAKGGLNVDYPTQEELNRLFLYFPFDGVLIRRVDVNKVKAGQKVGTVDNYGYLGCGIERNRYHLHVIIWIMIYGEVPKGKQLDHRDQDKLNIRLHNLRLLTVQQQARNRQGYGKTGVKGVCIETKNGGRNKYYRSYISDETKTQVRLGYSKTLEEAVCLRYAAEQCMGWETWEDLSSARLYVEKHIQRTKVRR